MTTTELMDKFPEAFRKLGAIIYNLNQIEISVVVALTVFFTDFSDAQSERTFILNEALFDMNIFETFEQSASYRWQATARSRRSWLRSNG
jgi:hypothetical protein